MPPRSFCNFDQDAVSSRTSFAHWAAAGSRFHCLIRSKHRSIWSTIVAFCRPSCSVMSDGLRFHAWDCWLLLPCTNVLVVAGSVAVLYTHHGAAPLPPGMVLR